MSAFDHSYELQGMRHGVDSTSKHSSDLRTIGDEDALELARAGKKQVLKRRFGAASLTGFACSLMITWEGTLVNLSVGLRNGGPAGLIYGFLFAFAGNLSVYVTQSELASMCPTAGSQYHWVSFLAPQSMRRSLSYVTGWLTIVAWMMASADTAYWTGTMISQVIATNHPSYHVKEWHGTLLMWATTLVCTFINTVSGPVLPVFEIIGLIIHIVGFAATIISLLYLAPKGNSSEVFTSFFNLGGWDTTALAFFVGLSGNVSAFIGADGIVHMSEEVAKSTTTVPRAMIYATTINGIAGLGMLIAVLYSAGNLNAVARSDATYPIIDVLTVGLDSIGASTALMSINIVMNACAATSFLASSSRLNWAFARERALPGWQWLVQIDKRTFIPIRAIGLSICWSILLGLVALGSKAAFEITVSIGLGAFCSSYFITASLLLYRRLKGDIVYPVDDVLGATAEPSLNKQRLLWGPWRLNKWVGVANNVFAVGYVTIIGSFSFWPSTPIITAKEMNWSSAILGGVMLIAGTYYLFSARRHYQGPIAEIKVVNNKQSGF